MYPKIINHYLPSTFWSPDQLRSTTIIFMCTFLVSCGLQKYCTARDYIKPGQYIIDNSDNQFILSANHEFQLGFFTPNRSNDIYSQRYLGIWYSKDPKTIVWVANRDDPISANSSTGVFTVADDGNLKLKVADDTETSYFSTNISSSNSKPFSRTAKLLDNGNLVFSEDQTGSILWQSFDYPTDTFLPGMKMNENMTLTSWKSLTDPGSGNFTFQLDQQVREGYVILNRGSQYYWKSGGSASGFNPSKMFDSAANLLSNFVPKENNVPKYGNISWPAPQILDFNNSRLVMSSSGEIQFFRWENSMENWNLLWSEPKGNCSGYNVCGNFGSCNSINNNRSMCNCLPGFEPTSVDSWNSKDYTSGCNRKSNICTKKPKDDAFLNLKVMKVENPNFSPSKAGSESECRAECLSNCQCQGYSFRKDSRRNDQDSRNGCRIWTDDLKDIQEDYDNGGYNLSIRVAGSNIDDDTNAMNPNEETKGAGSPKQSDEPKRRKKALSSAYPIVISAIVTVVIALCSLYYLSYKRKLNKRKVSIQGNPVLHLYDSRMRVEDLIDQGEFREDDKKDIDVPFFDLEDILAATDNFSNANKLGQGGFGPVYKGKFPGGKEIAVKRLSIHSGQGLEEFKNEVVLIAKLQHRNLVRLLGYCIKGNEKILLYEYMPNRSLNAFIFDEKLRMLLDWPKRVDIILGIARGLLYLHEDSRLRIIHRDMKTDNILLDEEMNPKISDFGLARIVGGRETQANTNRVVGTYGYMSPEYALHGHFSVKSDVFSFGVVVLEIISGKRNTGFYQSPLALSLLGYAWNLWKEEKASALMDQALQESCSSCEVFKCIIIGLLCVQEDPADRPTMSKVVFMLGSEIATLPNPKQPAFILRQNHSSFKPETVSDNKITFSIEEGR